VVAYYLTNNRTLNKVMKLTRIFHRVQQINQPYQIYFKIHTISTLVILIIIIQFLNNI